MDYAVKNAEQLAIAVKQGYSDAFTPLMEEFLPKLSRYVGRFIKDKDELDDIIQNIFVKAYTNIMSYDEDQRFSPWIYRIAHNESLNYIKKKKSIPFSFFEPDALVPYFKTEETGTKEFDAIITKKELDKMLESLSFKSKEIIHLYYYEELSYKEISKVLEIPVTTVGVRINRAKKDLEKMVVNNKKI